jgi:hypothetical protein
MPPNGQCVEASEKGVEWIARGDDNAKNDVEQTRLCPMKRLILAKAGIRTGIKSQRHKLYTYNRARPRGKGLS